MMITKLRAWLKCVRLLASASESLADLQRQREVEGLLLQAAREEAARQLVSVVGNCNRVSEVLLGLDAEAGRLRSEIERLRKDALATYEMRHHAVERAVQMIELRGKKITEEQRAKAFAIGHAIVADAEETSGRLMAGAGDYVAALYNAKVDDVLRYMRTLN